MDIVTYALCNKKISEKYTKPVTGIPKSDLEIPVQNSLDNGDEALQGYNLLQSLVMQILPTGSVEDSVVSVNDAMAMNALDVTIGIEPVQDLHGYDHPWPARGGKNLLPPDKYQPSSTLVVLGQTDNTTFNLHLKAGTYTVSLTTTTLGTFYYRASGGTENIRIGDYSATSATFTLESDSDIRLWYYTSAGIDESEISNTMLEHGSTATSYVPYSNICPITGWTGAKVTRTGKNLLPKMNSITTLGITYTVNADGSILINGTSTGAAVAYFVPYEAGNKSFLKPGTYTFSKFNTGITGDAYLQITVRNKDTEEVSRRIRISSSNPTMTFTVTDSDLVSDMFIRLSSGAAADNIILYPQLELGSTATAYEPYQGETYSITFPTEAGTVYGGTLDVTTGVLTVDRASVDLSTLTWVWDSTYEFWRSDDLNSVIKKSPVSSAVTGSICEEYNAYGYNVFQVDKTIIGFAVATTGRVAVRNGSTTVEPTNDICYELATPITYQLTPQQVALLLGSNTLYANTGDTALTYKRQVVQIDDTQTSTLKTWSSSKISEEISRAIAESLNGISST